MIPFLGSTDNSYRLIYFGVMTDIKPLRCQTNWFSIQSAQPVLAIVPNKDDERLPDECFAGKLGEMFGDNAYNNDRAPYDMYKEL